MRSWRVLLIMLIFAPPVRAQVTFISPLPQGILQVRGDHADLRLKVKVIGFSTFSFKLSSDIDTSSLQSGWTNVSVIRDTVDTLLTVPRNLRNYSIYWRTGQSATDTGGIIPGLTPGHVIGIAGQSNAQGYTWSMIEGANGDIRMLRNDRGWEPAKEPTGNMAGGPWIVMSNMLYASIHDTLPIGIVNTAIGSTGLTESSVNGQWFRNPDDPEDSSLYGNALRRFRHAGGELECLCWIQGEADAAFLPTPNMYRVAFSRLIYGLKQDLTDSIAVFHLQIGGTTLKSDASWPVVREAQRVLPPSTLVGTALGRSIGDGLHYTDATLWAVGRMFAEAILSQRYNISQTTLYPPLMPDTVLYVDSILDGSIRGRYCFSLQWNRAGSPTKIRMMQPVQYFAIHKDGVMLDTSQIWQRISQSDSTRVQIGLINDSITRGHDWRVTYDAVPTADRAPIATISASGDTIFGTAFYELPVKWPSGSNLGVKEFSIQLVVPNLTIGTLHCYILG